MWFAVSTAHAQYRTSIQGVVSDPTGAVIPGATLTLTNNGTNEKQVRNSDANGIYNFNALPPDTFTLVVTKDGFKEKDLVQLQLNPEQANSINVELAPGGGDADGDGERLYRAGDRYGDRKHRTIHFVE
jgi:hypothetical protein